MEANGSLRTPHFSTLHWSRSVVTCMTLKPGVGIGEAVGTGAFSALNRAEPIEATTITGEGGVTDHVSVL